MQEPKNPKYIFYLIGDGMGMSQVALANIYLESIGEDSLHFIQGTVLGMQTTHSANSAITCSSAAATALSTGIKTNNGMVSISPEGDTLVSIAKILHDKGYNIGIISDVSLDQATPAAFYANTKSRRDYNDIAKQMGESGFEFFGGGHLMASYNNDSIYKCLKEHGYIITCSDSIITHHNLKDGNIYANRHRMWKEASLPYAIDNNGSPLLPYYVDKMLNIFKRSEKGFFSVIEAGKIDWACHKNDAAAMIGEIEQLDSAYRVAYDFYLEHPDETLIIVTADHETGALGLGNSIMKYDLNTSILDSVCFSYDVFVAVLSECRDVEGVYALMDQIYGLGEDKLNRSDSVRIELCYSQMKSLTVDNGSYDSDPKHFVANVCNMIHYEKLGISWGTRKHSAIPVPVFAIGCGAENFAGVYDNTDIPKKILSLTNNK